MFGGPGECFGKAYVKLGLVGLTYLGICTYIHANIMNSIFLLIIPMMSHPFVLQMMGLIYPTLEKDRADNPTP